MMVRLSPWFRAQTAVGDPGLIACSGSAPANGERVLIRDSSLVAWLLRMRRPASRADTLARARSDLRLDNAGAEQLLSALLEARLLVSEEDTGPSAAARAWESVGWRDALDYHQATSNLRFEPDYDQYRARMSQYLDEAEATGEPQPPPYKTDPERLQRVELSLPPTRPALSVGRAFGQRRPFSHFANCQIPLSTLGSLFQASFGETGKSTKSILGLHLRKTSPSGGARHPVEVYVAAFNVSDLAPGLYHYSVQENSLVRYALGDFRMAVRGVCFEKAAFATAPAALFYSARWNRHMWKYRYGRSYRMVLLDAGHLAQTQVLVAAALGLTTFSCPSFEDTKAGELLGLGDNLHEAVLHLAAVGFAGD